MACPYFLPTAVSEYLRVARAPLGGVYTGVCHAGPEPVAPEDAVLEHCNFGYGRNVCPRFPHDASADAVRFTYYGGQLIYVLEREYSPCQHGTGSTLDPSTVLGHQAAVFTSNTHS
jgi:hypothetical protein